jgi:hypothetical protein
MHVISGAYTFPLEFEPFSVDGTVAFSRHGAFCPRRARKRPAYDMPPTRGHANT